MSKKTIANIPLLGGHAALDFTNTVDARLDRWGPDFLGTYSDLLIWARRLALIDETEAVTLRQGAEVRPAEASASLSRALHLREALYAVFAAEARNGRSDSREERHVATAVARALAFRILVPEPAGFVWGWSNDGLDAVTDRIAVLAAELLVERAGRRRIRECLGPNCGWLFLDTSRGGRRRWCSDETCGANTRVRRFRERLAEADLIADNPA